MPQECGFFRTMQAETSASPNLAGKRIIPLIMANPKPAGTDLKRDSLRLQIAEAGTSATELSRAIGRGKDYVRDYLVGRKEDFSRSEWDAITVYLKSKAAPGTQGSSEPTSQVAVMGRIGAGAEIMPEFEQLAPEGLYEIDVLIPMPSGAIAFEVEGTSMWPRYDPGDVVVCWREGTNIENALGHEAAVRTADGRRFLKRILRGSAPDTFDLESHNAEPIRGVRLEWVSSVEHVIRSGKWKKLSPAERRRMVKKALA